MSEILNLDLWPVTRIKDRYHGSYSGGEWVAYYAHVDAIPEEASSDDVSCDQYWDNPRVPFGVGSSPDLALADLVRRMDKVK